jgi:hypothetical protein
VTEQTKTGLHGDLPPLISVAEACRLLGVGRASGYRAAATAGPADDPLEPSPLRAHGAAAGHGRPGRRASGVRGRVFKRGATYSFVVDLPPDPMTGRRRQRMKGGFRTRRECERALSDVLNTLTTGALVETSRRTLRSFLLDEWLPAVQPALRGATWATYRTHLESYVVPVLGDVELQRLTPAQLGGLYRKLLKDGRRRNPGSLSPKPVQNTQEHARRAAPSLRRRREVGLPREEPRRRRRCAEDEADRDEVLDATTAPGLPGVNRVGSPLRRLGVGGPDRHAQG